MNLLKTVLIGAILAPAFVPVKKSVDSKLNVQVFLDEAKANGITLFKTLPTDPEPDGYILVVDGKMTIVMNKAADVSVIDNAVAVASVVGPIGPQGLPGPEAATGIVP